MPRRKKGKSRDAKGPQLPRYVREQLAVREERDDVASGFENADFHFGRRRSAGGDGDENEDDDEDEGAFGRGNRGGKASSTVTPGMSRKQKRREIKHEKKMNKKRRFEMQARKKELKFGDTFLERDAQDCQDQDQDQDEKCRER